MLLALALIVIALIWYFNHLKLNHWQRKGVKSVPNARPIVGSLWDMLSLKMHFIDFYTKIYNEEPNEKFIGYYQCYRPSLLIRDPELIKNIVIKDFAHFTDHGFKVHEDADPMEARHLFNMEGEKWRAMRTKLTPTFTSGRMKAMFPLVLECAQQLNCHLKKLSLLNNLNELEAKNLSALYTTDVIGSCAFGIQCNSLEDPDNHFRALGKRIIKMGVLRSLKLFLIAFYPEIGLKLRLAVIDSELTNLVRNMVSDVMELRKRTGEQRKDFIQLLMEIKDKGTLDFDEDDEDEINDYWKTSSDTKWTQDDITAQALVFFLAGFETSSTVMSFALLELAMNAEVQRKAQNEIDDVLQNFDGNVTYQALQAMPYLECIIQETLRKYPPTGAIIRICTKNYIIPGTNVHIEEGTPITIPIHALQNDPQYFPDPARFYPERFQDASHSNKFVHMPFGEGPRQCIGNRFAQMQSKLGLIAILRDFEVHKCRRTLYPAVLDPKESFPTIVGGTWLRFSPRSAN